MIKASGRETVTAISEIVNQIINEENIPEYRKDFFIINCYKGKGDATDRGNYRGLKFLEQVDINNMQFGFMPGCSTTDEIHILQQMQEKYLIRKKKIYSTFVDLEKAFNQVPHSILWWAMRNLGIGEWIVRLAKVMYDGANSGARVNRCFSEWFEVTVGVQQGSVLSSLLFAILMEVFSCECHTGCSW